MLVKVVYYPYSTVLLWPNYTTFFKGKAELSLFSSIKTDSAVPLGLKSFIRLAAGIATIFILGKQSVDDMTGKPNISKH